MWTRSSPTMIAISTRASNICATLPRVSKPRHEKSARIHPYSCGGMAARRALTLALAPMQPRSSYRTVGVSGGTIDYNDALPVALPAELGHATRVGSLCQCTDDPL